ncbi:hypothetical protein DTW90_04445 [Neorhizobium sp. P12A]|jgi:hypothetical protein|uniref:hypothetical protein n=1 Tax=Neorhizobium sp. P12A TaxID=2268027 RepID=UPI0011EEB5A7|nr:hypothetical protein [Neorhizobium sp. P12A]KAA0700876.1 hypothetical protein DTW90_04445 [Neorhizobium sp. P12A]
MNGRSARILTALCALIIFLPFHVFAAEPVHKPLHHRQAQHDAALKQAEVDAFRNQILEHWSLPLGLPGADKVHVRARVKLDSSGNLKGNPDITATGGPENTRKALMMSAYRSILKAAPFHGLPRDRYNDWREIVAEFNASDFAL